MELQFMQWAGLVIIIILFILWIYTIREDNERFKAIIDIHVKECKKQTDDQDEPPKTKREYSPKKID